MAVLRLLWLYVQYCYTAKPHLPLPLQTQLTITQCLSPAWLLFLVDLLHYMAFFPNDTLFILHHVATLFVCRLLWSTWTSSASHIAQVTCYGAHGLPLLLTLPKLLVLVWMSGALPVSWKPVFLPRQACVKFWRRENICLFVCSFIQWNDFVLQRWSSYYFCDLYLGQNYTWKLNSHFKWLCSSFFCKSKLITA